MDAESACPLSSPFCLHANRFALLIEGSLLSLLQLCYSNCLHLGPGGAGPLNQWLAQYASSCFALNQVLNDFCFLKVELKKYPQLAVHCNAEIVQSTRDLSKSNAAAHYRHLRAITLWCPAQCRGTYSTRRRAHHQPWTHGSCFRSRNSCRGGPGDRCRPSKSACCILHCTHESHDPSAGSDADVIRNSSSSSNSSNSSR